MRVFRILVLSLLLPLPAPAHGASRRADCLDRCGEAIAACASTCGAYTDMLRSCRRGIVKRCLREGASVCTALVTPSTSTIPAPVATSSTLAPTTTSTSSTTSTTLAPPVRERSASLEVAIFGTQSRLTVDVEHGPQLDVTVEVLDGSRLVCLGAFHVVQGTAQMAVSAVPRANACLASEPVCDRFVAGVVVRFTCTDFPAWFDPSAPFVVDWSGDELPLP